jgi:hypothetical protein
MLAWLTNCNYHTGSLKKNSRILLFNILVNLRHVIMVFVLEYIKTLQVLSSLVLSNASVIVIVDAHDSFGVVFRLCVWPQSVSLSVRWHVFSRRLNVCYAILSSSQL